MFREVKNTLAVHRRKQLADEQLEKMLIRRFDSFSTTFEIAKQTPKEFQLLNYNQYQLNEPSDMIRIGKKLGRFAVIESATDRVRRSVAA